MSEESQKEDRTEAPSERRLQHAWEQGNVPVGKDAVSLAALAAGLVALVSVAPGLRDSLVALVMASSQAMGAHARPVELLPHTLRRGALVLAVVGATAGGAIAAVVVQTRAGIWFELATPDFSRIGGGGRLKRLF